MDEDSNLYFDSTMSAEEARKKIHVNVQSKRKAMETEQKTCAQLIQQKMDSRNEQIYELYTIIDDTESTVEQSDEAHEELNDLILGVDEFKVVKIHLSTGGPADWIEVEMDDENHIRNMTYHYSDWFDHAETRIHSDSYLWEFALRFIEMY